GAVVGVQPVEWFSMNVGVYQGDPDGGRSIEHTLENLSGPMIMVEPAFHYDLCGLAGHIRPGWWWNGTRFDEVDVNDPTPGRFDEAYGCYLVWDQEIWKENPGDEEDSQGVGVFAQYGWSQKDRIECQQYYGAGFQWTGAIPSRDSDITGLGVFHARISDQAGYEEDSETVVEGFYRLQLLPCVAVKPDIQFIHNPGGSENKDALAVGVRWEVVF
ncbi:MAG TPA: carbohydrate porin, partial [bacterium]|nr:carbohydrate porin [bacterium]